MTAWETGLPPPIVWLASFPKSGNTWIRAILSAVDRGEQLFNISVLGSGAQPFSLAGSLDMLGLDARWLTRAEAECTRTSLLRLTPPGGWHVRKTHEVFRARPEDWPDAAGDAPEPFPTSITRAVIHVVRDPRDVVPSFAHHFGISVADAVEAIGTTREQRADPARLIGEQPWGTWTTHTQSWMRDDIPFPVHRISYEDLHADPVSTLLPVLGSIGVEVDEDRLMSALARVRLDRLQDDEERQGFRETHARSERFFRRGRAGGWRDELPADLVRAIEADHGPTMRRLGYELVSDEDERHATVQAREAARRHAGTRWDRLPVHLGLVVEAGDVPASLEGAVHPNRYTQVVPGRALVTLTGGNRVLVSDGARARVHVPADTRDTGDSGWLAQGWAVAIAMMQRGHLTVHGSAVEIGGRAVCIAGHSGAGKSSSVLGLRSRGHRLLVDDVSIIDVDEGGSPAVIPYLRGVHLTRQAAQRLGIDFGSLPHLSSGRGKATFFAEDPGSTPVPLALLVVIAPDRGSDRVDSTPIVGAARIAALSTHASREMVAPAILGQQRYFDLLTRLADVVPVVCIRRPVGRWSMDAVLDRIESIT